MRLFRREKCWKKAEKRGERLWIETQNKFVDIFALKDRRSRIQSVHSLEGPEGVKWKLGFAHFFAGKMGFHALGLGFINKKTIENGNICD